ncbi:MAG: HAMP domain-containing protein [Acidobacteriota bacterium]|nr:HAMP domain-containing protein [Acidobacteriota bacterium]
MRTSAAAGTDTLDHKRLFSVLSDYQRGDFGVRMPDDRTGLAGKVCDALNATIERNERLVRELERLSAVVGKAGNIKQRAQLPYAEGGWSTAVESINALISDLVQPTTEVARVIGAVAKGDLTQTMSLEIDDRPLTGEFLRTAKVVNTMVAQLGTFSSEVTRVAREVGSEGKLGGQAIVKGVAGTWKDLTDSVNLMAANLTSQVRNIAEVTTAVAKGDLSKKVTVDVKGEILELKNTVNTMVDQLSSFASEVTRVAKEVGTEGQLGGQADVRGVAGTWKDLTDNVNAMAGNLTVQLRDVSKVSSAIASGDLSRKITVDARGEILQIKDVINTMVDQLSSFASEVTRVAKEVGTEGKLGGQADVRGVAGTWKDLTDNVNGMASNLTNQVRNIAEVTTAVALGDLSKKITVDARGEILELKDTVNTMVDQLSSFASEVTRVAKEVGTEGKLGGQADVRGVAGTWKDLTDNVNELAGNLTVQLRDMSKVSSAIASGDLNQKITVQAQGEILQIKNVINTMVDQLSSFASEVTRVAKEVCTEGKLGGQAEVGGVAGTWEDLTDNVNAMASNLTNQVRNIADVTTAVARGDLSKKITVDARGEILELKNTVNTMVDQLSSFASEVTRVAKEVGTEGKLGGQADVRGVAGTWKDLTDNVNELASNLTVQLRDVSKVATAIATGDLNQKITVQAQGEILQIKNVVNTMTDQLNAFASEVTRVAKEVGTEGKLGGQADVRGVAGTWRDLTDSVNSMAGNLTGQVRNIAEVTTAVARGDLSKKITVAVRGEILELKNTMNTMVDQLSSFASEVTRVAREVGTEGELGGQADVPDVGGTWKDLTDSVNFMAANLTSQVRNIAEVTTAVARGDLSKKVTVDVKGEILELKDTVNTMVDQLSSFAAEVTRMAKEVGSEGRLGGQADVPGVAGTWKDLTDNVNRLAANLTTQVRAIAEVATAVTKGDLSQSINVEAAGEVAALKDNINEMIVNLRETTEKNTAQDWLKTNLAKFTRLLQGQRDLTTVSKTILSELAPLVPMQHGVIYFNESQSEEPDLRLLASYAYTEGSLKPRFKAGEGLVGQAAVERQPILLSDVPQNYVQVSSGLGAATPTNIFVVPVLFEGQVKAVIELASFYRFNETHLNFLGQLTESIGIVLNTITATMRTEELLKQSQSLATELQKTNEELEEKAELLATQNAEVEQKNREIDQARLSLEDKAAQLALTSRYKSEFLANMSHELRTPLNSLLILSRLLAQNTEGTLTEKQVEFAKTIHASGSDLLELINEILDLSKIESGMMDVDAVPLPLNEVQEYVDRTFREVANSKGLAFKVDLDPRTLSSIITDQKRVQQVLKNLISNAIKFTESGSVTLTIEPAASGWSPEHPSLSRASAVVAFRVEDTGIGISPDKHQVIFEAFQQADGTTSRKYGGTGLGLSISREIAKLLGGEIRLASSVGKGSTFVLYLPSVYVSTLTAPDRDRQDLMPVQARLAVDRALAAADLPVDDNPLSDDRSLIQPGDRVLLVIENDLSFARILMSLGRAQNFRALASVRGDVGLTMARQHRPDAITLDLDLPGLDGWNVLDRLKHDPSTRHIPVHVISVSEDSHRGMRLGARTYLAKPSDPDSLNEAFANIREFTDRKLKTLLIVEDDEVQRETLVELIGDGDVKITAVGSGQEALDELEAQPFDCIVLDLGLNDMSGLDLLEKMRADKALSQVPVIVYTGKELTKSEEAELRRLAQTIIIKDVKSPERLLEETALFLHRVESTLPAEKQKLLDQLHRSDPTLAGKKALVVDDDIRNIFALTSILERYEMNVQYAENGHDALRMLNENPDINVVLMDVMMPEMDGYEATRRIRDNAAFENLPIIALTAKAMKGDREKCINAGASDYVTKPVDTDHLISLLRVWLSR